MSLRDVWQYEKDVLSGKVPSGKLLRLAVERNRRDMSRAKKKDYPYYFDEDAAVRIIKFCELCHHWKGSKARTPIELEPNQKWRLALKYGWKDKESKGRRFRKFYEEVARKNAKTTEKALEAIYHMMYDGGFGACVVAAATKSDQAKIVVNDAGMIIERTPGLLKKGFRLFKNKGKVYEIRYIPTDSNMFALGRDSDNQDGLDPSMGIIDEYHAHKDDGILEVVKTGMQARTEPMLSIITTAGFDMEGPCYKVERKNAIHILEDTKQDERYFISIYAIDKEDEENWDDPKVWIKSNPNMGASVVEANMMADMVDAKNKGGSTLVGFKTKNVNMWVDAPDTWIESDIWALNTVYNDLKMWPADSDIFGNSSYLRNYRIVTPAYVEEKLAGRECWGGLDLSNSLDFSAYVLVFKEDEDGRIPILPYIWTTQKMLKKLDERIYYDWVNEGFLFACDGNLIDHGQIWEKVVESTEVFDVLQVAYDPYLANHTVVQRCMESDLHWLLVSFGQSITNVTYPTKFVEETCHSLGSTNDVQAFEHYNNPVLKWMMANVEIVRDNNGNIRVTKKDPKKKVDAVAALINACASKLAYEEQEGGTISFIDYDQVG